MRRQTACLLVYCCRGEVLLPQSWLPKNETGATVLMPSVCRYASLNPQALPQKTSHKLPQDSIMKRLHVLLLCSVSGIHAFAPPPVKARLHTAPQLTRRRASESDEELALYGAGGVFALDGRHKK